MAEMKGIKLCGECGNYDWKKHKCKIGCNDDSNAQASFYGDCPLPDVVPKSEVERLSKELDELAEEYSNLIIEKDKTFDEGEAWYKKAKELEIELNAMRGAANSYKMHYNNLVREIFREIEKCKVVMGCPAKLITFRYNSSKRGFEEYVIEGDIVALSDIAELKKKYIGRIKRTE